MLAMLILEYDTIIHMLKNLSGFLVFHSIGALVFLLILLVNSPQWQDSEYWYLGAGLALVLFFSMITSIILTEIIKRVGK